MTTTAAVLSSTCMLRSKDLKTKKSRQNWTCLAIDEGLREYRTTRAMHELQLEGF